jgi:16S rRNA (cytosine967-C5)-methyltransferase
VLGVPRAVGGDAAVRLVRRMGVSSAAGLVNAVLRRAPDAWSGLATAPPGLRYSHPDWLVERWTRHFGATATETMLAAHQSPAPPWAWFRSAEARRSVEEGGAALEDHPWLPDCVTGRAEALVAEAGAGRAYIQDPASQLVADVVAGIAGERAADVCAAPGGKAARWTLLRGSPPFIADSAPRRVALVAGLFARLGWSRPPLTVGDATAPALGPSTLDTVLADAPCSGTGTLRRHPELRWRLAEGDLYERAALQRRILDGAGALLRPGGHLLYSTCSIEPEENEDLMARPPEGMVAVPVPTEIAPDAPWLRLPGGGARVLPSAECDGFTLHLLRRSH